MSNQPLTETAIGAFATAWYLALDQHAPVEECLKLVSDDVEMIFPEATLHGSSDFAAWCVGGAYSNGEQAPGVFNIFFDENHNVVSVEFQIGEDKIEARVVVAWQASWFVPPAAKSKRVSADFTQAWTLRPSTKNPYGLVIESYNAVVVPPSYAPGFARL